MSYKGSRQLKQFLIRYSDIDGSSKGVREWMKLNLVDFAVQNPETAVRAEIKRAVHPFFRAYYQNGNSKTICIKNLSVDKVSDYSAFLRNQIGRKLTSNRYNKPVISNKPSIQGIWNERMDLIDLNLSIEIKDV